MTDGLKQVRKQVAACTRCVLAQTRRNSVPGEGSFHSDVILVGEAPGRSEDAQGRPFVGYAGRLLDAALEYSGMSRDEVYITNVVKCRPPGNRIPSSEERTACDGYLQKEIQIIDPKIVCVMGNTAFGSVLGGRDVTRHRGKMMRRGGRLYLVTVHPAAAIYRRELAGALRSDIRKIAETITELKNGGEVPADVEYPS